MKRNILIILENGKYKIDDIMISLEPHNNIFHQRKQIVDCPVKHKSRRRMIQQYQKQYRHSVKLHFIL